MRMEEFRKTLLNLLAINSCMYKKQHINLFSSQQNVCCFCCCMPQGIL